MATMKYEIGYRGYASLGGSRLLATGGSCNINQDPIMASGVWGAGAYNAAENVIYAPNYLRLEGDISFELASGDIFTVLKEFTTEDRATGKTLELMPNGAGGYSGDAWCSQFSLDCSEGAIVSGSVGFTGVGFDGFTATAASGGSGTGDTGQGSPLGEGGLDGVFPYWGTSVSVGGSKQDDIISWNASYSSEVVLLSLCSGATTAPTGPDYVMMGSMTADGSFTLYGLPSLLASTTFQGDKSCSITMNPTKGTAGTVTFGKIIFSSGGTSIQTGSTYVQADFSFTALGDGTKPPMGIS